MKRVCVAGYYGNSPTMTSNFCDALVEALERVVTAGTLLLVNGSCWSSCAPVLYWQKHPAQRLKFVVPCSFPFAKQHLLHKSYVLMERRTGKKILPIVKRAVEANSVVECSNFKTRDTQLLKESDAGIFFFLKQHGRVLQDAKYGGELCQKMQKQGKPVVVFHIQSDGSIELHSGNNGTSGEREEVGTASPAKAPAKAPAKVLVAKRPSLYALFRQKKERKI